MEPGSNPRLFSFPRLNIFMGIITETGAGTTGANSYTTLEEADAYHADRDHTEWAEASTTAREAALITATDYIEAFYRPLLPSVSTTQPLQWPCYLVDPCGLSYSSGVPARLKAATIILAMEAISGPLIVPVERGTKSVRKKLDGVGETETEFDDAAPFDRFPAVTAMLDGIATPKGSGTIAMGRLTR